MFLAVQAENKDALYFVGLFCVANIEFLPEYRQKESKEFLSVAQNVQHVVRRVGCLASKKMRAVNKRCNFQVPLGLLPCSASPPPELCVQRVAIWRQKGTECFQPINHKLSFEKVCLTFTFTFDIFFTFKFYLSPPTNQSIHRTLHKPYKT